MWSIGPTAVTELPPSGGAKAPEFATCKLGKHQSPIDIRGAKPADLPAIKFDYKPSPLKVIDNGHTIQVNYAPGSSIDVGGVRYELVQFHFHKPSEEKIAGKSEEALVQNVTVDATELLPESRGDEVCAVGGPASCRAAASPHWAFAEWLPIDDKWG
jgi:Eukaryotic-type carbonic anhydrase